MKINDVIAVIVIYNLDIRKSFAYNSLKAALKFSNKKIDLFIYDNSPVSKFDINQTIEDTCFNITFQSDTSNSGVSKAYNTAAIFGKFNNKKWILLLDQDTFFPTNSIDVYLNSDIAYPNNCIFCPILRTKNNKIVSPSLFKFGRGYTPSSINFGLKSLFKYCPVNSGLLITLDKFFEVGGYDEKIKLDYSDYSFFKKIKKNESYFVILPIICEHQLSTFEELTVENSLNRFKYLCIGCYESTDTSIEYFQHMINLLKRAIYLSFKFKNLTFFNFFIIYFIKNDS
jgi:GT2 family glycosyltransferase